MSSATLGNLRKFINLIDDKKKTAEELQALYESGLFSLLLDADVTKIDRAGYYRALGLDLPVATRLSSWPAPNEVFELTLDFSARENGRLQMVRSDGYSGLWPWDCTESRVVGTHTRKFALVEIGYQSSFDIVEVELAKHGVIPEGEWRNALKNRFPRAHGRPVGIADASWVRPGGCASFPCVDHDGDSDFVWTDIDFSDGWLWLVEVE